MIFYNKHIEYDVVGHTCYILFCQAINLITYWFEILLYLEMNNKRRINTTLKRNNHTPHSLLLSFNSERKGGKRGKDSWAEIGKRMPSP